MGVIVGHRQPSVKPSLWRIDPQLVDHKWRWLWESDGIVEALLFWEGGGGPHSVRARSFTLVNGPVWSQGEGGLFSGMGMDFERGSSQRLDAVVDRPLVFSEGVTFWGILNFESLPGAYQVIYSAGVGGTRGYAVFISPTNFWSISKTGTGEIRSTITPTVGARYFFCVSTSSGGDGHFTIRNLDNGSFNEETITNTGSLIAPNIGDVVRVGSWVDNNLFLDGLLEICVVSGRMMSAEQRRILAYDPYDPFRMVRRQIAAIAPAAGVDQELLHRPKLTDSLVLGHLTG